MPVPFFNTLRDERMTNDNPTAELLALNQRLLDAIARADWAAYQELCHPDLTCFEPESRGQLVEGMAFHKFYFDLGSDGRPVQNTMASPRVRMLGDDAALIVYVRLIQRLGPDDCAENHSRRRNPPLASDRRPLATHPFSPLAAGELNILMGGSFSNGTRLSDHRTKGARPARAVAGPS